MAASRREIADLWSSDDDDDDDDALESDGDGFSFHSICDHSRRGPRASPAFDSLASALQHDVSNHGFDLVSHLPSSGDEDAFFDGAIRLVNKSRQFVKDSEGKRMDPMTLGRELDKFLKSHIAVNDEDDVSFYKPVLEDDAMLMCIDELQQLKRGREEEVMRAESDALGSSVAPKSAKPDTETVQNLREQISLLQEQLSQAKSCIARLAKDDESASDSDEDGKISKGPNRKRSADDDAYFASYSDTSIHEKMLRDAVRTSAYEEAILSNSESLFRGRTVLDVGCGTGVLSLFCARAGARRVIAVDNSDVLKQAEEIVRLNGFERVVTCVRGKVETLIEKGGLPLSEGETVDVIVSEWMGYALLFETMLPSVVVAREAFMTPRTGTMFPNVSAIFVEGANAKGRLEYWDDVHSFDMAPMKERMAQELTREAWVEAVDDGDIVTDRARVIEFDLNSCGDEELDFEAPFVLRLRGLRASDDVAVEVHQLVVSFDVDFSVPGTKAVSFSTGCQSALTHWKQTVLWFDRMHNFPVLKGRDVMRATFRMKRNAENHRGTDMAVAWETGRTGGDGGWVRAMDGVMKRSLIA